MKIVYIAHPVASPSVYENLAKIREIAQALNLARRDIVPFVPYMTDCMVLDDTDPKQRSRGMGNNRAILESGMVNEIWLYGDRISEGMKTEITICQRLKIPIVPMTAKTEFAMQAINKQKSKP